MWIPAGIAITVLIVNWQVTLLLLAGWAFFAFCRWAFKEGSKPVDYWEPASREWTPVRVGPVPGPVKKPKPARELPAAGYLPRWTSARRAESAREHVWWQESFDRRVKDHAVQE